MLEKIKELPMGVDGVRAWGTLTRADYDAVLLPIFEEARREGRRIRLLLRMGPDFEGVSPGGELEGIRVGVHHLQRVERCAVVTDDPRVRLATQIKAMMGSFLLSCRFEVFHDCESARALEFLTALAERPPMQFRLLASQGLLVLEPQGALRAEDFEAVAAAVDPWVEAHGTLSGVVVRMRSFPGWEDLAGLMAHLQFVRDHEQKVRRVALVADGLLVDAGEKLAAHFVSAEVRRFAFDDFEDAVAWAEKGSAATERASAHRAS